MRRVFLTQYFSGTRQLLIFARDWSPDETAVGDPMLGLSLHDGSGTKLLDLSPRARRRTEPDVWAAVLVAVNPGPYRLRLIQGDGAVRERMVFATRDWQTSNLSSCATRAATAARTSTEAPS